MKPVDQTTYGTEGNCFSACVASILEMPLAAVPQFMTIAGVNDHDGYEEWWDRFLAWCATNRVTPHYIGDPKADAPAGYAIKSGRSPRHPDRYHAVVVLDGVLVHDPRWDDRRGVGEHLDYITLTKETP